MLVWVVFWQLKPKKNASGDWHILNIFSRKSLSKIVAKKMCQDKCKSSLKYVSTTTVYSRKAMFEGCRSISTYSKSVSSNIYEKNYCYG